jgi:hypothetical protein
MKKGQFIFAAIAFAAISGCMSAALPHTSPQQAEWAATKWQGMNAEDLARGQVQVVAPQKMILKD